MRHYIEAEYIKGKRTFSHFFFTWLPILAVLICVPFSQFMYFDINFFVPLTYNWWPSLFLPIGLSVLSYQTIQRENESHTYNYYSLLNQKLFWKTKMITLVMYSFLANSLIAILTIVLEHIMYEPTTIITLNVLVTSFILWLTTLFIIPISILIAQLTTPLISIVINLFGIIIGIFTTVKDYWYINPWGWSLRLITPVIKTNPNGTLLKEYDPLNTPSIIFPGLCLSVLVFTVLYFSVPIILSKLKGRD